jgi:3-hydroxyisobutyrate dehydrogenase-like beta-hydroxyacid dehydrogenase
VTSIKIGFVGFGEVASVFSIVLQERGADVIAFDIDESKVSARGVPFYSLPQLVQRVDYVLSTVTTQVATQVATDSAAYLKSGQIYLDLNSTSPSVKVELSKIVRPTGADFVEGAILGAVGATGAATRILTGGQRGREVAEALTGLGLRVSFYDTEIGKASMFKMLRSIFSKGLEALILELLIAGRRAGIEEDLWKDVSDFMARTPFDRVASNWVQSHAIAYERRYHEMVQVRQTMREIGLGPVMTAATESFFDRSRAIGLDKEFQKRPDSMDAVVAFMEQRLRGL